MISTLQCQLYGNCADKMCFDIISKMSDQILEQHNNITFHVTLGKDANDTCAVLSEAYRGEATKKCRVT